MVEEKRTSFAVADMVEGGGLLDNIDVTWKDPQFVMWDYDGKVPVPVTALCVRLLDREGGEHPQYWSAGGGFTPSKDGSSLVASGGSGSINAGSNFAILVASMEKAGIPEGKMKEGNIKVFDGMEVHMERQAAPKRGTVKQPRADGRVFEDTVLVVTSLIKAPWEKGVGKKGAGAKASAETGDVDVAGAALITILGILENKPNGITRQLLASEIFKAKNKDPNRQALMQMVYDDEFMSEGPWVFEGGVVKIAQ